MMNEHVLRRTFSVCPVCLRRLPAQLIERSSNDDSALNPEVWMEKECPDHGHFSTVIWRGSPSMTDWLGSAAHQPELDESILGQCPHVCGACTDHQQGTCCVLLEISSRCNLQCAYCFASAAPSPAVPDPSFDTICKRIDAIASSGKAFLQLSGGEPTLRHDLPAIVRHAKAAGCAYIQLNSNGLRLAEDEELVAELADAGLSFVFMQFDGTEDSIYQTLRNRPLMDIKCRAIEACGRHNLGVTLVPTLVPGVNTHAIGEIVRFAVMQAPVVRGVHFQPVSHFGRTPQQASKYITLPEVVQAIYTQAGALVPKASLVPSRCDHARCGFHGAYLVMPEGLHPLSRPHTDCCSTPATPTTAEQNRHFVGTRWQRLPCCECAPQSTPDINTLDGFLQRARSHSFTISAMAFQDAHTLDLERLRQCSLHVYANDTLLPFCAHYIGLNHHE